MTEDECVLSQKCKNRIRRTVFLNQLSFVKNIISLKKNLVKNLGDKKVKEVTVLLRADGKAKGWKRERIHKSHFFSSIFSVRKMIS